MKLRLETPSLVPQPEKPGLGEGQPLLFLPSLQTSCPDSALTQLQGGQTQGKAPHLPQDQCPPGAEKKSRVPPHLKPSIGRRKDPIFQ